MGISHSKRCLEPASETLTAPYELRSISAPRMTGLFLRLVIWILDQPWSSPIWNISLRKSGVPQVTRDLFIPDPTTFMPLWALPTAVPPTHKVLSGPVKERLEAAASSIPGFASYADGGTPRRWRVSDYIHAYKTGATTPLQVAESIIECIAHSEKAEPPMKFLIALDVEDLRKQAAASTARYQAGAPLSVMDGVPYTAIDGLDALPYPTTAGTSFLASTRKVKADAPCIRELKAAGALLVGKANLHEIGVGMTGLNTIHGTSRNPYDVMRYTGGSSSGSAAIVSSGLVPFALGIDGGGSVRVPSALCGLVGLRPTVGRTSREHCPDNAFSIMAFGVLAASVSDALLVHSVISNAGMEDVAFPPPALTIPRALHSPAKTNGKLPLEGKRVGLYQAWFEDAPDPIVTSCYAALRTLQDLGCEVVNICIPELEYVRVSQILTIGCELAAAYKQALSTPSLRRQFTLETRMSMGAAERFTATDYLQAQKIRTRAMTHFKRLFEICDFVVSPTVGCTAPKIQPDALEYGESDLMQTGELMRFTIPVNMAGIPAITLPVGYDTAGLPIGMQLMGRGWAEADLLYAGSVLEAALADIQEMPKVFYDPLHGKVK